MDQTTFFTRALLLSNATLMNDLYYLQISATQDNQSFRY
jgi:hypothetical protein